MQATLPASPEGWVALSPPRTPVGQPRYGSEERLCLLEEGSYAAARRGLSSLQKELDTNMAGLESAAHSTLRSAVDSYHSLIVSAALVLSLLPEKYRWVAALTAPAAATAAAAVADHSSIRPNSPAGSHQTICISCDRTNGREDPRPARCYQAGCTAAQPGVRRAWLVQPCGGWWSWAATGGITAARAGVRRRMYGTGLLS